MIKAKRALVTALAVPILALAALTLYKKYILTVGTEVVLPIRGFDPRDLLAGHYLIYQIEYGVDGICSSGYDEEQAFVCLKPKEFLRYNNGECELLIAGSCRNDRFEAGIEKFFVPEEKALLLEQAVQEKTGSIVLSVTRSGETAVKDLLIDGRSWQTYQPPAKVQ
ncbi:MAG: GDYXXLXY domain-containing protein [Bdellovibrionaceae bacterium]|nr:GDYXXLXY domain-containing protein [Pseudobdellovibrionaceae bacterium]